MLQVTKEIFDEFCLNEDIIRNNKFGYSCAWGHAAREEAEIIFWDDTVYDVYGFELKIINEKYYILRTSEMRRDSATFEVEDHHPNNITITSTKKLEDILVRLPDKEALFCDNPALLFSEFPELRAYWKE